MKRFIVLYFLVLFSFSATNIYAAGNNASAEWQIKAYSSAAPSFIGDFATIIDKKLIASIPISVPISFHMPRN